METTLNFPDIPRVDLPRFQAYWGYVRYAVIAWCLNMRDVVVMRIQSYGSLLRPANGLLFIFSPFRHIIAILT